MIFQFNLSDELKEKIRKIAKKNRTMAIAINKKIREIVSSSPEGIERYKDLRFDLKGLKRVHVLTHFVLTFRVFKKDNFILFEDFDHHDKIYKR